MPDIRFATKFRSADTNEPGLVMEDDGTVWLVNPGGSRTQLPGGGGGGPGTNIFEVAHFVETPGAGTYTATFDIPDDSLIVFVAFQTTAAWDATTALLDIGITGDLELISENRDVQPLVGDVAIPAGGPPVQTVTQNLIATLTTTGAGGSTGRTVIQIGYAASSGSVTPVKS